MAENRWTVVFAVGAAALAGAAAGALAGLLWTRKPGGGRQTGERPLPRTGAKDNGAPAANQRPSPQSGRGSALGVRSVCGGEEEEQSNPCSFRRRGGSGTGEICSDDICADEIQEGIENLLRYAAGKVKGVEIGF